jgi:hypothetical protein
MAGYADQDLPVINAFQPSSGGFRNSAVVKLADSQSCSFSVNPISFTVPTVGESSDISVTTGSNCWWNVTPGDAFGHYLVLSSDAGTYDTQFHPVPLAKSSGTVSFTVDTSTSGLDRTRTFIIAGRSVKITQLGYGCPFSFTNQLQNSASFAQDGGPGSFNISTNTDCPATAIANDNWISIPLPNIVSGGQVNYNVAPNLGAARTGTISIAGLKFTVKQ